LRFGTIFSLVNASTTPSLRQALAARQRQRRVHSGCSIAGESTAENDG